MRAIFQTERLRINLKASLRRGIAVSRTLRPGACIGVGSGLTDTTKALMIALKRAYDSASGRDGTRFLVERLWPRGVSKAKLRADAWLKEVGPSTHLRKWFSHDPGKWAAFRQRYFRELDARPEAWKPIVAAARRGRVTLVYSSHDTRHNNAVALQQYLRRRSRRRPVAAPAGRTGR